jgi:hypothetical protein
MADYVSKKGLKNVSWELPIFDSDESALLALRLVSFYKLSLRDLLEELGIRFMDSEEENKAALGEFLEYNFGGIPGYVAELIAHMTDVNSNFASYTESLLDRIDTLFTEAVGDRDAPTVAKQWLASMSTDTLPFKPIINAGLAVNGPPNGSHLRILMKVLLQHASDENILTVIAVLRQAPDIDPGLDGNLLELETLIRFSQGRSLPVVEIKQQGQDWIRATQNHPNISENKISMWSYTEVKREKLVVTATLKNSKHIEGAL